MSSVSAADVHPARARTQAVRFGSPEMRRVIDDIARSAAECKRDGKYLHEAIDMVRQSRLGALRVPREEGGGGSSVREMFAMLIDLAEADSDVVQILRSHYWFVEDRLRSKNLQERARWVERIVQGDIFGNAMTEIGGSAPVGSWVLQTQLNPHGDGHVLNGKKYYCTGSMYSDWVAVLASTPDGKLASAVVPTNRAGVNLDDDWDGMGQKLTGSGTGIFSNVEVHADEVLQIGVESSEVASVQNEADPYMVGHLVQLILTANIAGALKAVVTDAVQVVRKRTRTFAHASAETAAADPLLQQIVGEIASSAFAAEAMILLAAEAQDQVRATIVNGTADFELAHRASLLAAQAKVVVDDIALRAATRLFNVGGASSVKQSENLDRHWRNIRTLAQHNPVPYKARAIGDFLVNGVHLPTNGFF